jgi:hypothetical protein
MFGAEDSNEVSSMAGDEFDEEPEKEDALEGPDQPAPTAAVAERRTINVVPPKQMIAVDAKPASKASTLLIKKKKRPSKAPLYEAVGNTMSRKEVIRMEITWWPDGSIGDIEQLSDDDEPPEEVIPAVKLKHFGPTIGRPGVPITETQVSRYGPPTGKSAAVTAKTRVGPPALKAGKQQLTSRGRSKLSAQFMDVIRQALQNRGPPPNSQFGNMPGGPAGMPTPPPGYYPYPAPPQYAPNPWQPHPYPTAPSSYAQQVPQYLPPPGGYGPPAGAYMGYNPYPPTEAPKQRSKTKSVTASPAAQSAESAGSEEES